ncbi:amidohydrolase family protein [Pseudoalteromonas sp. MMG012]|uniref:metal-dependent hydrolase family protein n=1 Tax=Pseudoalteromonas sp. MMG012 TaxID=2822686 RepID=UPI001B39F2D9|nr:amidohydrolase family protein [Pseudoalteromonas sp. MMG012]MBQ4850174.1 amidohydrolase family protein [Pseudoalteromonas sp. MMG012]
MKKTKRTKQTIKHLLTVSVLIVSSCVNANVDTIIYAGQALIDPLEPSRSKQTLVIDSGKVAAVYDGYRTPQSLNAPNAKVYDLKDKYVMPGLIDMHVHLAFERNPAANPHQWVTEYATDQALRAIPNLSNTLEAGFTSVRDLGGPHKVIFALKRAVDNHRIIGPRIFAAGDFISATGGHGDLHGYRHDINQLVTGGLGICNGADDCRRAVRSVVKSGADVIKVTATGGVLSNTAAGVKQQLTDDELAAIVTTAHSLGRKVTAHAHGTEGINAAIKAGVNSIEHGSYLNKASIELFKQHGTYLVPTLLAGATVTEEAKSNPKMPAAIVDKVKQVAPVMKEAFQKALKHKINIAFGTDSGVSRHGTNAKEAELMVAYGMSEKQVLVSATVSAAKLLGQEHNLGRLNTGMNADIIALNKTPEHDIRALQQVPFVMKAGIVYKE